MINNDYVYRIIPATNILAFSIATFYFSDFSVREYCMPGNFSDVETLANLATNSFSLKLQVANLVLHCNTSTSIKVCTTKNAKLAKI